MAELTDLSDVINRMTGGNSGNPQTYWVSKLARIAGSAAPTVSSGRPNSYWRYDGTHGAGAIPTAGEIPTRTTAGALPLAAVGSGRERWLIQAWASAHLTGWALLYDRLYHIGGLSGTSTDSQTVQGTTPSPALTRNTGGAGNMAFYEIYTAVGATGVTLTMTYVNQDGTNGRTSTASFGTSTNNAVGYARVIPLASGDSGIRSVTSVQLSATTGTAGNWGITIARPIAYIPIPNTGAAGYRDFTVGLPGLPKIDDDACLAWLMTSASSLAQDMWGGIATVDK